MAYNILQQDIDILFQSQKEIFSRVEILDFNFKTLVGIDGILISDSYSIDAESDVRRSYSCEIHLEKDSYFIDQRYKLMSRYIRPYVGIKYIRTGEIIWYLMGTFCFIDTSWQFDSSSHTLSLSCQDMMCLVNGTINGNTSDTQIKIVEGENIRDSFILLLEEMKIKKYLLNGIDKYVPYDLEFSGTTYYEILKKMLELYPGYEMFFDINGTFILQKIKIGKDEENLLNDEVIQPLLISDNGSFSFGEIFNHIKVYGQLIETDRDSVSCTYTNNVYNASFDKLSALENGTTYSISIPSSNLANAKLNINNLGAKKIVIDDGVIITKDKMQTGKYSFRYRKLTDDFLLLGKYQVFGEAFNRDPKHPFSINALGFEKVKVFQDAEYESLYSDDLAKQMAEYELYLASNLAENVSLEMITIPWLDVNYKIEYTSKNFNETHSYIIKSISGSTSSATMTISMIKYYIDYSET
jgi:hypothetical protein